MFRALGWDSGDLDLGHFMSLCLQNGAEASFLLPTFYLLFSLLWGTGFLSALVCAAPCSDCVWEIRFPKAPPL